MDKNCKEMMIVLVMTGGLSLLVNGLFVHADIKDLRLSVD